MTLIDGLGRHSAEPPAGATSAPRFPALVRVELARLLSRRFFRVMVGIGLLGYVIGLVVIADQYHQVTPEVMQRAVAARDAQAQQNLDFYRQCLADPQTPAENPEDYCGGDPSGQEMEVQWFIDVRPFDGRAFQELAMGIGVGVALLGLFVGASSIGAEWSSRNLVAWLFWEPRRLRLLGAKLLALLGVLLVLAVLAQVIWYVTGKILLASKGIPIEEMVPPDPHFWTELAQAQLRGALFVLPAGLIGFGLANLMRNTAATLGVALVYLLGVETLLGWLSPHLVPFQFSRAALGWILPGGFTYFGDPVYNTQYQQMIPEELVITNLQGGLVVLAYGVVITAASLWLFRRRDIT